MLYSSDCETDDDRRPHRPGKCRATERRAFHLLSSVCSDWHHALTGWPQSSTPHWVRHKTKKLIECKYIYSRTFRTVWTTRSRLLIGWHGHVVRGVHFLSPPRNNLSRIPHNSDAYLLFFSFFNFSLPRLFVPSFFLSSVLFPFFFSFLSPVRNRKSNMVDFKVPQL